MNRKGEIASSLALMGIFFMIGGVFLGTSIQSLVSRRIGTASRASEECFKSTGSILFDQPASQDLQFGINTVVYGVTTFSNKVDVSRGSDLGTFDYNYNLPTNQKGKLAEYSLQLPTGYSITNGYCKDIEGNACVAATWVGNTIKNVALNCGNHVDYGWSVKKTTTSPGSCTYKTRVRIYENQINDASLVKFDESFGDSWKAVNNKQMELKFKTSAGDMADKLFEYPNANFTGGAQYSRGETASVRLRGPNDDQWDVKQVYCKNNSATVNGCPKNMDSQNQSPQRLIDGFTVDCGVDIEYGWVLKKHNAAPPNTPTLPTRAPTNPPTGGPTTPTTGPTTATNTPTPKPGSCSCQQINQPNLAEGFCTPGCSTFKTNGSSCEKTSDCTTKKVPNTPTKKPTTKLTTPPTITPAPKKADNTCAYIDLGDKRHLQTANRIVFAPIGFEKADNQLYRNLIQQAISNLMKTNLGGLTNYLSFSYITLDSKVVDEFNTLSPKEIYDESKPELGLAPAKRAREICTAKYAIFLSKQSFRSFTHTPSYVMISVLDTTFQTQNGDVLLYPDIMGHESGHMIALLRDEYLDATIEASFAKTPVFGEKPGTIGYNCSLQNGFIAENSACRKWDTIQNAECRQGCYFSKRFYRSTLHSIMEQGIPLLVRSVANNRSILEFKSKEAMMYNPPSLLSWEKILKDNAEKAPSPFRFDDLEGSNSMTTVENKIIAVSAHKDSSGKWTFGKSTLKNGFITDSTVTDTDYLTLQVMNAQKEVIHQIRIPAKSYMIVEGEGEREIVTTSITETLPFDDSYASLVLLDENKRVLTETKITPSSLSNAPIESLQLQLASQDFTNAINLRVADVDLNGTVNSLDYLKIQKEYGKEFSETDGSVYDLNKDGRINSADLSSVIKYLGQSTN